MLAVALQLATAGYAVFPVWSVAGGVCACDAGAQCVEPGKHPVGGAGHLDATTDEGTIAHWWGLMPDASIGIACHASGLLVLDVDPRNGGLDSLAAIERDIGDLEPTTTVLTGGGGYHFYYRLPSEFAARGKLAGYPGVDIKVNGYVIAPPSTHASGSAYTWANDRAIATLPGNLAELVRKQAPTVTEIAPVFPPASIDVLQAAREHLAELGPAIQGQGGDAHTYRACATMLDGWGLSVEESLPLLWDWDRSNVPPWGEFGLLEKLRNAANYAERSGGAHRRTHNLMKMLTGCAAPFAVSAPVLEPGESFDFAAELQRAYVDLLAYRSGGDDATTSAPMFEPATNLLTRAYPKMKWLVRGIIPMDGVGVSGGQPKSAKTWAAIEMALAVATNTLAFGQFQTGPAQTVAMFLAEDSERSVRNRLRSLAAARKMDPAKALQNIHVYCRRAINLLDDAHLCRLIASARMIGARLVCLDPMRNLHDGNEDSSGEMSSLLERLRAVRTLCGASVLFVHHTHKDSKESSGRRRGQQLRGSSAIHGAVDFGFYMFNLDSDFETTWSATVQTETRDAKAAGIFQLDLNVDDDEQDEAKLAEWTYTKEVTRNDDPDEKKEEKYLDKIVATLLSSNSAMTIRSIRSAMRTNLRDLKAGLNKLEEKKWVRQIPRVGWALDDTLRTARGALTQTKVSP